MANNFKKEKDLVDYFRKQINKTKIFVLYSFENSTSDIINGWPDKMLFNRATNKIVWLEFKLNHKITPNQKKIKRMFDSNNYDLIIINEDNYLQILEKIKQKDKEIINDNN